MDVKNETALDFPALEDEKTASVAELRLENVISQLGGDSPGDLLLKVYKINPRDKKRIWQVDLSADSLPLEPILYEEFGGGMFEVHIYVPTDTGAGCKKKVPVNVREKPVEKKPDESRDVDRFERMLESIARSNQETIRAIADQQKTQFELLASKMGSQGGEVLTVSKVLELLPLVERLIPKQQKTESPIETMRQAIAFMNEVKEQAGGGDGLGHVFAQGMSTLKELALASQKNPAYRSNPAGRPELPPATDEPLLDDDDMFSVYGILAKKLKELVGKAAQRRDTITYANVVLDEVPESFYGMLVELLGDDDQAAVDKLAEIEPSVNSYREWFLALCANIREGLVLADEDAGELTGAGGAGISAPSNDGKSPHALKPAAEARDSKPN